MSGHFTPLARDTDRLDPPMPRVGRSWLPLLPERGKVSAFEIALLALCVGLIAADLPQSLRDVMLLT